MAKIKKIQEGGTTIYPATITNAVKDPETGKTLPEIFEERNESTYPKMSVGFAENIVGDGSATAEEFSFRPTAGVNRNTLNDGAARIHTLKGRSMVVNEQFHNPKFLQNTDDWLGYGSTISHIAGGGVKVKGNSNESAGISQFCTLPANHYILIEVESKRYDNTQSPLYVYIAQQTGTSSVMSQEYSSTDRHLMRVIVNTTAVTSRIVIYPQLNGGSVGYEVDVYSLSCTDLTQEFGAGNEPTTVAEYYQRKPILLNEVEYNEGTLVNLVPKAIKTTGFNQWDEQWRNGYYHITTGEFVANSSYVANVTPIKVLPKNKYYIAQPAPKVVVNLLDANGKMIDRLDMNQGTVFETNENTKYINFAYLSNSYNNDVCVCLYWPTEYGNLYGTYKPYKPFERDLSWVNKYFPAIINGETNYGMRSAGSAHDEIRFNSTEQRWEAVQRVGVVDLGDLTWTYSYGQFQGTGVNNAKGYNVLCPKYSTGDGDKEIRAHSSLSGYIFVKDSSFTDAATFKEEMQGVMLNYELAESIVTPITENINLDYDVSDYGTEELIVAEGVESAPLSASIEYSPNVLAVLKNAPNIANDVDALKSQVAALTAALTALTTANTNE